MEIVRHAGHAWSPEPVGKRQKEPQLVSLAFRMQRAGELKACCKRFSGHLPASGSPGGWLCPFVLNQTGACYQAG